jgi:hypothetical protein
MKRLEPTVYQRTLARAMEIAGTEERLSQFLGVPLDELRKWIAGDAEPPLTVFLALTDIVAANFLTPAALSNLDPGRVKRRPTPP